MAPPPPKSAAPPIIWGSILIATCLVLAVLWHVVIVSDYFRIRSLAESLRTTSGTTSLWILPIGTVLFIAMLVGVILFLISNVRQIRTNIAQRNFIDAVTHELKTPLTSLRLHLQTLQMGRVPEERLSEFHGIMLADIERLDRLVDHVLAAAKVDTRRLPAADGAISLVETAREIAIAVALRHQLPPDTISVEGESVEVCIDRTELDLVLTNLLDNAIKFSIGEPHVSVSVSRQGSRVGLDVTDQGAGIPRKFQKRIFQRFYRVGNEQTRLTAGTGLGLYIVREMVHRARGKIRVSSRGEGQGTTFRVLFPEA